MTVYVVEQRKLTGVEGVTVLVAIRGIYSDRTRAVAECIGLNERRQIGESYYTIATWEVQS